MTLRRHDRSARNVKPIWKEMLTRPSKHPFRNTTFALVAVVATVTSCARILGAANITNPGDARTTFHEIHVGDARRNFLLHRPPRPYHHPLPLFVLLHGSSANANVMMQESGMNAIADSIGAIVVYPNGTGEIPYFRLFWNEQGCCNRQAPVHGADEERMLSEIVDTLSALYPIDRSRVGLAGFSDPGSMAYLIACDQSRIWSAIGVIAGKLPHSGCTPPRGVSTIVFHGTADSNIRYGSTSSDVASWASRLGCTVQRSDSAPHVSIADYSGCRDGAEVRLYSIAGGKHGWPGGKKSWPFAPQPPRSVDASRLFAAFVLDHPRATAAK